MDMMSLRRRIMGAEKTLLPREYQQVEYLESTGTQYLETNYVSGSDLRAEWSMAQVVSPVGDNMFFGWKAEKNSVYAEWYGYPNVFYGASNEYKYSRSTGFGTVLGTQFDATMDNDVLTINGVSRDQRTQFTEISDSLPMYVFAWNEKGTTKFINKGMRLYYLRFYESGVLSASFIPCYRKADQKPGMYDLVSGEFYTNAGSGEFIVGSDV